ncbi:MAG: GNAT family N-acetyltransferase [Polyangiaceae bacterium]
MTIDTAPAPRVPSDPHTVRALSLDDVDACLACARTIGWTAPPEAWALMLEIGRGFGATAKGALAGAAIAFPFGDVFAMVAMMMVRADVQRQGVGRAILAHARDALPPGMAMALYASPEGERLYRPFGFVDDGVSVRWEGLIERRAPMAHASRELREIRDGDADAITALDSVAQGAPRRRLMESLLARRAAGWVIDRGGLVEGFGLGLREQEALRIGPIVCARDDDALAIADALTPTSGVVRLDLEPGEEALLDWAKRWSLERGELSPRLVFGLDHLPGVRRTSRALAGRAFG